MTVYTNVTNSELELAHEKFHLVARQFTRVS